MSPSSASLAYFIGIAGLFYLNRDKSVRTSKALWIPVMWFWILGSRAVSIWLGLSPVTSTADTMMDGSPFDAFIFQLLIAGGLAVLVYRGRRCRSLLMANLPIVWYFSFCLVSAVWSDYPDISAKRWIKALGDLAMALVVLTDAQPVAAMRRLFSRVGFVLIPCSTLLIKYYPYLGRGYDDWTGQVLNTGVTTDKNILGVTTYILTIGAFWQVLRLWRGAKLPNRFRQFLAQGTLVGFGFWNLFTANSATSEFCLILAALLMVVTGLRRFRNRPAGVQKLVLTILVVGALIKITGADEALFHALGRNSDLTGRASTIWPLLFPMAPNALLGAGFETFWLGPRLHKVWEVFSYVHISEAHNGYLEVYLNLGAIGVCLIIAILIHGYRSAVAAFRIDPESGSLVLSYVLTSAIYSYTEAGFRSTDYAWSFLLMAIIHASRISRIRRSVGVNGTLSVPRAWSRGAVRTTSVPVNG